MPSVKYIFSNSSTWHYMYLALALNNVGDKCLCYVLTVSGAGKIILFLASLR